MAAVLTVRVTRISDGEPMVVNATDFDDTQHRLTSVARAVVAEIPAAPKPDTQVAAKSRRKVHP